MTPEHIKEWYKIAADSKETPEELFKRWGVSVEYYDKINADCKAFCKEIEFWLTDPNFDKDRLSLLTSNLDCLLFERFLENRDEVHALFLKADSFLESHGINFLIGAMKREGFTNM